MKRTHRITCLLAVLILFGGLGLSVFADEFTSSGFRVLDPVIFPAGFSTSASFQLTSTLSQLAIGTSSAASFGVSAGFEYFPFVTSPSVSASAGNGQATLSWTTSSGFLGWTVSGYDIGQATVSGGPYSYTSVGNVTTSIRSSLTNGTTYFFVVRPQDAFGNAIATSTEVSTTPTAPAATPAPSGGGGGGGGGGIIENPPPVSATSTRVTLRGRAFPFGKVSILRDGVIVATTIADDLGNWRADMVARLGIATFTVYGVDTQNRRSLSASFTATLVTGQTLTSSEVLIPPTIVSDKALVKQGNTITFSGFAYPDSAISVIINSEEAIIGKTKADKNGTWTFSLNSGLLKKGEHAVKIQEVTADGIVSLFSESIAFTVGDIDAVSPPKAPPLPPAELCNKKGDINKDGKTNIIDFSILLFFWNQNKPSNPCADINKDGIVNIFDFSIMLYWWTG